MKLVIVESPTKARTISQFLGSDFKVESSYGHVRDLPEKKLGIDIIKNFEPQYVILPKAKKRVADLKSEAKKSEKVILATDEDREGEAISWHLVSALGLEKKPHERIVFHEITKSAIEEALKNPRGIDMRLVDAQQARRILDRLVGYKLSPFLWKKVARGLSAGRVQSVAVRLVVEREKEVLNFKPEEYHSIYAVLRKSRISNFQFPISNSKEGEFLANLIKIGEKRLEKFGIKTADDAKKIISDLDGADYSVEKITKKEMKRQPLPPFTTSTLQQTAFSKFGFGARQTMVVAQQLYETGFITYMRTDSVNLSKESVTAAFKEIEKLFGKNYLLPEPRIFKTKSKSAQEAHEAVRPTQSSTNPDSLKDKLTPQQFKLYDLIWRRFLATQMPTAVFEATSADISAERKSKENYVFRATGNVLKFDGFLKVYPMKTAETNLPNLLENEELKLKELKSEQHFTEPPARYNEASLIKALEEHGIGRPSTYAPTLATIQARRYVIKDEQKRLKPTDIGILVSDILVLHFPKVVDIKFTAKMEEDLDDIADGKKKWQPVIKEFWEPFKENLDKKSTELSKSELATEATELKCPECGKPVIIRMGRYGKFYACTGFPACKYTANLEKPSSAEATEGKEDLGACKKCDTGQIVKRRTRKGKTFWGCSSYPQCDWATWQNPNPPSPKDSTDAKALADESEDKENKDKETEI
ncbi:MAG: type I DNA topoisomerase [Parcubacteria group bacterium]|nr:type I DNA topoisomerase [Parcubacteria group bacterium]